MWEPCLSLILECGVQTWSVESNLQSPGSGLKAINSGVLTWSLVESRYGVWTSSLEFGL